MNNPKAIMVGCGRAGIELHHGPFRSRGVEYVAVVDPNSALAEKVAKELGIARVYSSLAAALAEHKVDFVDIATPPSSHFDLASTALRAGVNVFIEKPMTEKADEAEALAALAREKGLKLVTSHNHKYMAGVRQALQVFRSGKVGEFLNLNFNWAFIAAQNRMMVPTHWAHEFPGGVLLEGNPHPLYIAREFAGALKLVSADGQKISTQWPHVEADEISILLQSRTGYVNIRYSLHMEHSYSKGGFCGGFLLGTKGALFFDYGKCVLIEEATRGNKVVNVKALRSMAGKLLSKVRKGKRGKDGFRLPNGTELPNGTGNGFGVLADGFLSHLAGNGDSPVSLEEAVENVQLNWAIGEAVRDSLKKGPGA